MKHICKLVVCMMTIAFLGCKYQPPEKNVSLSCVITTNEYNEIDDIINYRYGPANDTIKKRMLLSEIARHYSLESDYSIDTIAPVIMISYEEKYNNYEVYCIGRADPWVLDVRNVTRLELIGRYIVAYVMPDEDILPKQEIIQFGINTDCPILRIHEASWFVLLSPNTLKYTIVKNVFSREDAYAELEQNKRN